MGGFWGTRCKPGFRLTLTKLPNISVLLDTVSRNSEALKHNFRGLESSTRLRKPNIKETVRGKLAWATNGSVRLFDPCRVVLGGLFTTLRPPRPGFFVCSKVSPFTRGDEPRGDPRHSHRPEYTIRRGETPQLSPLGRVSTWEIAPWNTTHPHRVVYT